MSFQILKSHFTVHISVVLTIHIIFSNKLEIVNAAAHHVYLARMSNIVYSQTSHQKLYLENDQY